MLMFFIRNFYSLSEANFHGFYTTITAISNTGFSLDNDSLALYSQDYFIQMVVMLLIIFGAIGFPVLIEVKHYLLSWKNRKRIFRFSLFTKVTTTTFFALVILVTLNIYLIDMNGF